MLLTPAHPPPIPQRSHAQTRTHFLIVNEDGHVLQVRAAMPSSRHLGQVSSQTFKGRAVHLQLGETALSLSCSGMFMTIANMHVSCTIPGILSRIAVSLTDCCAVLDQVKTQRTWMPKVFIYIYIIRVPKHARELYVTCSLCKSCLHSTSPKPASSALSSGPSRAFAAPRLAFRVS